ncbi:MAG: hypothetical protein LUC27_03740, partial [Lachnospiraceae bacterium]|nr:hypothetical protein [Lachnospiraceae bacterium]
MLVSLEITSLPEYEADTIRQMIEEKTGIHRECIWVCAAHSFSSPHLLPDGLLKTEEERRGRDAYRAALQEAACKAATDALAGLRPAVMGTNAGFCAIVANRDVELEDGWWVGTNGDGPTDPTVSVIRFELEPSHMEIPPRSARRQDDSPMEVRCAKGESDEASLNFRPEDETNGKEKDIVLISHFAMQSSVLDQYVLPDGGKVISSDVVGNACRKVEEAYGDGTVAMHLIGAAGDQAPIEKAVIETYSHGERSVLVSHEDGFAICERLSEKLSKTICELA